MMDDDVLQRLNALRDPWWSFELVQALHGVDLAGEPSLGDHLAHWSRRFRNRDMFRAVDGRHDLVDRHDLETFLEEEHLIPKKWAAIDLGMDENSFENLLAALLAAGFAPNISSSISAQLVLRREAQLLYRAFPMLRHRTFSSHSSKCRALHQAARDELGVEIQPMLCVTSRVLDHGQDIDLAATFDAINLEPVGLRHQVWLDTRKPINLSPDVCSVLLFARHQTVLSDHVMQGSEPRHIDDRLRAA